MPQVRGHGLTELISSHSLFCDVSYYCYLSLKIDSGSFILVALELCCIHFLNGKLERPQLQLLINLIFEGFLIVIAL